MKLLKIHVFFITILLVISFTGCIKKDLYQDPTQKYSEVFDFKMTNEINLDIDYGLNKDYYVFFELYTQNPIIEKNNSFIKNDTLEPIFKASTEKGGKYSNEITLPSYLKEVWLYSDFYGTVSPLKLTVIDNKITFNQKDYISKLNKGTRSLSSNGFSYPNKWKILPGVTWDEKGFASNIEKELYMPSDTILFATRKIYNKTIGKRICDIHKDWMNESTSEIKIDKETEVSLVFIDSGAAWNNSVGYFTYPTNTVPNRANIQKILAFPNISSSTKKGGALVCGNEVKLKYWNEKKQIFEDKFPAGITIGLFLSGMSFNNGNINEYETYCRYSCKSLNEDSKQRSIALRDKSTNKVIVIGIEDNSDFDYGDAIFYLKTTESNAVSSDCPTIPKVDFPKEYSYSYFGTLAFEDQWPNVGDYDMNDVILEYRTTLHKKLDNILYKIVEEFMPVYSGGIYTCGFGYQLPSLNWSNIKSINFSGVDGVIEETDQTYPTIKLFDNIKDVLKKKITVTTEFCNMNSNNSSIMPPYNPFIFVNNRSNEIHLVNYPPTDKVNISLFNTCDDKSNPEKGIYYITDFNNKDVNIMPYGINIPYVANWKIPAESVKIFETYPSFINWVKSKGKENKDWYKYYTIKDKLSKS